MARGKTTNTKSKRAATGSKPKAKRTPNAPKVAAAAAAPVPKPAPVAAAKTAPVLDAQPESLFVEKFQRMSELTQQLQQTFTDGKAFTTEIRKLVSSITRYEKKSQRARAGRKRRTTGNTLSGITRPVLISDQLCKFLGESKGTLLARTAVTKRITAYIREHNLQNPDNRKQIFPDVKLQALLIPLREQDRESGYTFFNLQHYLKHNYHKAETTTGSSATTSKEASATA